MNANKRRRPELLAPAGNLEKLRFAVLYGADAVYLAGLDYGLRAAAGNFSREELSEGIAFAHANAVKAYVTVNIFAHDADLAALPDYLCFLREAGADALIVSDPGVFRLCRRIVPELPLHISTQANSCNSETLCFWQELGAARVVLARELSLPEIKAVAASGVPTEVFLHGAMCMAYSGRCYLSHYLTGRDGNRGDCAQSCRWRYALVEEKRSGEYFPLEEDARGAYLMNSRDLCLLAQLPQLLDAGVCALKIEGRMKSSYYVANVTRVYRAALDACLAEGEDFIVRPEWQEELEKVSHRPYGTGFAEGVPGPQSYAYESAAYLRPYDFAGLVLGYDAERGMALVEQRNNLRLGDEIELISPCGTERLRIESMEDEAGLPLQAAAHARMRFYLPLPNTAQAYDIIRRKAR